MSVIARDRGPPIPPDRNVQPMNALFPTEELGPVSLADVIARLSKNRPLSAKQQRDLISAVNTAANLLDRLCVELEADVPKASVRTASCAPGPARHVHQAVLQREGGPGSCF